LSFEREDDVGIKRSGFSIGVMGEEFKRFLKAMEVEERSSISLGETSGPLLDLYETADSVVVEADVPGITTEDVEVSFLHGVLTVEGVRRERLDEDEKVNYLCMERSFESFRRVLKLTVPVSPKDAKAVYSRGVLTLTFPKIKEKRGEVVKIKVEKK
jgi:HSP20 family protein